MIRDSNVAVPKGATEKNDNMAIYLKGAPEKVISRCSTMLTNVN